LGTKFVEGVSFDEKIQQELAHVPANLRLKINRSNIGQSNNLRMSVSIYTQPSHCRKHKVEGRAEERTSMCCR
jgi:hypothetical protein